MKRAALGASIAVTFAAALAAPPAVADDALDEARLAVRVAEEIAKGRTKRLVAMMDVEVLYDLKEAHCDELGEGRGLEGGAFRPAIARCLVALQQRVGDDLRVLTVEQYYEGSRARAYQT